MQSVAAIDGGRYGAINGRAVAISEEDLDRVREALKDKDHNTKLKFTAEVLKTFSHQPTGEIWTLEASPGVADNLIIERVGNDRG